MDTKTKELLHVLTYNNVLCKARPGDPPMLTPAEGTNCPECAQRLKTHSTAYENWLRETREGRQSLEVEQIRKKRAQRTPKKKPSGD